MATNKQLLNEISRFQAIAGLRPINSLNEDAYEEGIEMEGNMGQEPMDEAGDIAHYMDILGTNWEMWTGKLAHYMLKHQQTNKAIASIVKTLINTTESNAAEQFVNLRDTLSAGMIAGGGVLATILGGLHGEKVTAFVLKLAEKLKGKKGGEAMNEDDDVETEPIDPELQAIIDDAPSA